MSDSEDSHMFRFLAFSFLSLGTIATLNASQITIGQDVGAVNDGLTASYIASGCAAANGPSYAGCLPGSTGGNNFFLEKNYAVTLFSGVTTTTPPPEQTTVMDSTGVKFALINDGTTTDNSGTYANNYWDAAGNFQGASGTLTIPIGIFGADAAWTMIDNRWGVSGLTNTIVTFFFGTSSNLT